MQPPCRQDEIATLGQAFEYLLAECRQYEASDLVRNAARTTTRAQRRKVSLLGNSELKFIRPHSLRHVLGIHGLDLTVEEVKMLFNVIDLDQNDEIDRQEFIHFGLSATTTAHRISATTSFQPGTADFNKAKKAVMRVMRLIPPQLQEHFSGQGEIAAVAKWVKNWDVDGDNQIDAGELQAAMSRLHIPFGKEEVKLVFPILDLDGDGKFSTEVR
jgi:Ca2+-binding EF-hand superfamily protein